MGTEASRQLGSLLGLVLAACLGATTAEARADAAVGAGPYLLHWDERELVVRDVLGERDVWRVEVDLPGETRTIVLAAWDLDPRRAWVLQRDWTTRSRGSVALVDLGTGDLSWRLAEGERAVHAPQGWLACADVPGPRPRELVVRYWSDGRVVPRGEGQLVSTEHGTLVSDVGASEAVVVRSHRVERWDWELGTFVEVHRAPAGMPQLPGTVERLVLRPAAWLPTWTVRSHADGRSFLLTEVGGTHQQSLRNPVARILVGPGSRTVANEPRTSFSLVFDARGPARELPHVPASAVLLAPDDTWVHAGGSLRSWPLTSTSRRAEGKARGRAVVPSSVEPGGTRALVQVDSDSRGLRTFLFDRTSAALTRLGRMPRSHAREAAPSRGWDGRLAQWHWLPGQVRWGEWSTPAPATPGSE